MEVGTLKKIICWVLVIVLITLAVWFFVKLHNTTSIESVVDVPAEVTDKYTSRSMYRLGKVWRHRTHYHVVVVDEQGNEDRGEIGQSAYDAIDIGYPCVIRYTTKYNSWFDYRWVSSKIVLGQ